MKKPTDNFSSRFTAAKQWRDEIKPLIEGALMFGCPGREFDFNRLESDTKTVYETQVYVSMAEALANDLGSDLVTYYTPAEARWVEYLITADLEAMGADEKEVLALVQAREDIFFDLMSASNYNDIAPQWGREAAIHGTAALWVTSAHLQQPIHFEVVPPHQLYIVPGHMGYLDRFREMRVGAQTLPALLAEYAPYGLDLSDQSLQQKMKKPSATCKVIWGFWLDWMDAGNPVWRCEITVDGKRVTPDEPPILGPLAGSCPLLVGRFNPQPQQPWGRGPGIMALPDLRVLDKVSETVLAGLDQAILNTIIYADDGMIDMSEGLQAGRAYPAHRGFTRDQIAELGKGVNIDQGWFAEDRIEDRVRTAFYQDGPRQRGETPPTAAQWLDERRRVQQRLGKPSAPIWTEMIYPMVQRVEFLAVKLGRIPEAISHDGQNISLVPISPLQKAQKQDEVMTTRANLDLAFAVMQDQAPAVIDMQKTFENIKRASGDQLMVMAEAQGAPPVAAPPPA